MSRSTLKSTRFLSLVLTAILIVATLLIHPAWPHARNFGYAPFLVSAALTCVCVLILFFGPERRSRFRSASDSGRPQTRSPPLHTGSSFQLDFCVTLD